MASVSLTLRSNRPNPAPRWSSMCAATACRSRSSKSPFTNAFPKPEFRTAMSNIPEQLRYAASHEWIKVDGDIGTVGISDHAQSELSDVVFVDLPKVGAKTTAGAVIAVVESVKAASDIYSPVSGEVTEANAELVKKPESVNSDPY